MTVKETTAANRRILRTILEYVQRGHTPPPEDIRLALVLVDTAVWKPEDA